jgi:hypothetical protein
LRIANIQCKRLGVVAYIEYENIGEPRQVGMQVRPAEYHPEKDTYRLDREKEMKLNGPRKEDPDKIAAWIKREFLEVEKK